MNKIQKKIVHGVLLGMGVLVAYSCCIGSAHAAELKVGYVNIAKVFDSYKKTQKYDADLTARGRTKEQEFDKKVSELEALRKQLETMNDSMREEKGRELEAKADELKRFRAHTARDLQAERDKMAAEVLKEIEAVVEAYGKENGFDLLVDGRSVLFGNPSLDVTDAVLAKLNSM